MKIKTSLLTLLTGVALCTCARADFQSDMTNGPRYSLVPATQQPAAISGFSPSGGFCVTVAPVNVGNNTQAGGSVCVSSTVNSGSATVVVPLGH